jgi:hypothetical protein
MKKSIFFLNFLVIMLFGLVFFYPAFAWTEPSGTPPDNNVSAPINVSDIDQSKLGGLGLKGSDPGLQYGLSVGNGSLGVAKFSHSRLNNSVIVGGPMSSLEVINSGEANNAVDVSLDGRNATGLRVSNRGSFGTGLSVNSDIGATIVSEVIGLNVISGDVGVLSKADRNVFTGTLYQYTPRKTVAAKTMLAYYEGSDPVGLTTTQYNSRGQLKSNAKLASRGMGISAYGTEYAGYFNGPVEIQGTLRVTGGCSGCGDIAEAITQAEKVGSGEIVATNDDMHLIKATFDMPTVIGVVSTAPSMALNDAVELDGQPVALAGIVPVKVNRENGVINKGDFIAASMVPGIGAKAVLPGTVIGKALQDMREESGTIKVFVSLGYFAGTTCGNN